MANLNFPANPTIGQVHTAGNKSWEWNGVAWAIQRVSQAGKSAYDIAIENGFVGTEAQWISSLKGDKGERGSQGTKGDTGLQGPKGDTGDRGADGTNGTNGTNGQGVPTGGSVGQVLTKNSSNPFDTSWQTPDYLSDYTVPLGGNQGQYLGKRSAADGDFGWLNLPAGDGGTPELPQGGNEGQVLTKNSAATGDVKWANPTGGSGVPDGGTTGQVLTKNSNLNGDATWQTVTGGTGDVEEAPLDGKQYARQDGTWSEIASIPGNGGGGIPGDRIRASARINVLYEGTNGGYSGQVVASGINIESVTRVGPGRFTVTFSEAISDINNMGFTGGAKLGSYDDAWYSILSISRRPGEGMLSTKIDLYCSYPGFQGENNYLYDPLWFSFEIYDPAVESSSSGGSFEPAWTPVTATGTGISQNITLPQTVAGADQIDVYVNGLHLSASQYSVSGTTVTLTSNASGDIIEIRPRSVASNSGSGVAELPEKTGNANKVLAVKSDETGVEWIDPPAGSGGSGEADPYYRMAGFFTTSPAVNEILMIYVVDVPITLPANFSGSQAKLIGMQPQATFTLSIRKNSTTEIGTLTVNTDGSTAYATSGGTAKTLAAGDAISIHAPGVSDVVSNLTWILRGNK